MELGNQYSNDDVFKAKARKYQSEYRMKVLKVDYQDYGNRLNDNDAQKLLNYYDKLGVREVLRQRYPVYSRKRDADLLRSEHIPFNLFAPFCKNTTNLREILIDAFSIKLDQINSIQIEYAPSPKEKYLNDLTSFDVYISGLLGEAIIGIGIEVKYTEKSYQIGNKEKSYVNDLLSPYWKIASSSKQFSIGNKPEIINDDNRQIWRNHLLGLSMIDNKDIDRFYTITIYPEGNDHFNKVLDEYKQMLKEESRIFCKQITYEKYISILKKFNEYNEWAFWLHQRYCF